MNFVPLHANGIPQSLYLHYPLCKHHCSYCDFVALAVQSQPADFEQRWLAAIETHLTAFLGKSRGILKTLYLGGGTPSLISNEGLRRLKQILQGAFNLSLDEFTVECNPENLSREKLIAFREIGVTRLSVGVQSFDAHQLRRLERLATHEHIAGVLSDVKNLFTNFSIDLMIGIPDQTVDSLEQDLHKLRDLNPPHVSVYLLTLDSDHKLRISNSIGPRIADDESAAKMYERVAEFLEKLGYNHYEVSNFAKPGFRSLHNSMYWDPSQSYLGLGPGAHGYLRLEKRVIRYECLRDLRSWSMSERGLGEYEEINRDQERLETLYLKLRTRQPIETSQLDRRYALECERLNWLKIENDAVTLTRSGWLLIESLAPRLIG